MICDYAAPLEERDMSNPKIATYINYLRNYPTPSHDGGEFWSAMLWDLRNNSSVGASVADQLVYDGLHRITPDATFLSYCEAIIAQDMAPQNNGGYNGAHVAALQNCFVNRGIFWSGTITQNVTWYGDNNIYVFGPTTIASGVTVTIEPGVNVTFAPGASLVVNGTLTADAGAGFITFQGSGTPGSWGGITFNSGSSGILNWCNIYDATTGVTCSGSNSLPPITSCDIRNNSTGISVCLNGSSSNPISCSWIENNTSCGIYVSRSTFYCDTNTIANNGQYGIDCWNSPSSSYAPIFVGNEITGNMIGLLCYQCSPYLGNVNLNHGGNPGPGPGYNVIEHNAGGINAAYGSNVWAGDYGYYGKNSIAYNTLTGYGTNYGLYALYDGVIYARYNWWNGTPSVIQQSATVYDTPVLPSDPNASMSSPNSIATSISPDADMSQKRSVAGKSLDAPQSPADSSATVEDELEQLMLLQFQGKWDEAAAGYEQVFSREWNTTIGRYSLRKLKECFTNLNEKGQFDVYLKSSVKPLVTSKDELYALLVEFDNETLFDNGNYQAVATNLKSLITDFKNNEPIYKHEMLDLGFLYLNSLHDTSDAKVYFSQLEDSYPNDLLTQSAEYLMGEYSGAQASSGSNSSDTSAVSSQSMQAGLSENYPNPFNPTTMIKYQLLKSGHVTLRIYDILGREVATLVNENQDTGIHSATFDGSRLASGVYFYRLTAPGIVVTKKMVLTK